MESIYVIVFITCFVYLIFDSFKNINIKQIANVFYQLIKFFFLYKKILMQLLSLQVDEMILSLDIRSNQLIPRFFDRNSPKLYPISQIFIDLNRSISCIKCYSNFSQLIFCGQIADKYYFICHDKLRRTNQIIRYSLKTQCCTRPVRRFGSTRSQVRILSPRLNQNQVTLESFPNSLFYCLQSQMREERQKELQYL